MATTENASLYASSSRGSFLRLWKSHNLSEVETGVHVVPFSLCAFLSEKVTSPHSIHITPPKIPLQITRRYI
jgi:hypothetical protein